MNIHGILGTIIVHLIIGILFMGIKLSINSRNYEESLEIELLPVDEELIELLPDIELPGDLTKGEEALADKEYKDIAVNKAEEAVEEFNIDEYMEQLKNEMIDDGELGEDNFIDQQKQRAEEEGDLEYIDNEKKTDEEELRKKSEEMAANYRGPTRVFYDLEEKRYHTNLPLPIYKCEHGGKVVLEIYVAPSGKVTKALVLQDESTTDDNCLYEAARKAALSSRFNAVDKQLLQQGTITYIFAEQ